MFIVIEINTGKFMRYHEKVIVFPSIDIAKSFTQQFSNYAILRAINSMDFEIMNEVFATVTRFSIETKPDFLKDEDIILFENLKNF